MLDTLIGQLLTLARIDSGADQRSLARIDFTNLVQEIASDADFEARAQKRCVIVKRKSAIYRRLRIKDPLFAAIVSGTAIAQGPFSCIS